MREFRDPQMWDRDRIHLSPLGHRQIAVRVLEKLSIPHGIINGCDATTLGVGVRTLRGDLHWAATFAAPYVLRRLRRLTPGAGFEPKMTGLTAVLQDGVPVAAAWPAATVR